MRSVAFYTTSCALWNRPYFKSLIFFKFGTIGGTLCKKIPIFSSIANYSSFERTQKMQSNETVIIAYSWFYDELQASEFLTFPFSKLKLKFSIWDGGTLKCNFIFTIKFQFAIVKNLLFHKKQISISISQMKFFTIKLKFGNLTFVELSHYMHQFSIICEKFSLFIKNK